MNTTRACGCKSFRSCFRCEPELGLTSIDPAQERLDSSLDKVQTYCTSCELLYHGTFDTTAGCQAHEGQEGLTFPGIKLLHNYVSVEEEAQLEHDLDTLPWDLSQSGRRKQNFGPRANFKKRKSKVGSFCGFPICTKFIQDRFYESGSSLPYLDGYRRPVELALGLHPHLLPVPRGQRAIQFGGRGNVSSNHESGNWFCSSESVQGSTIFR